MAEVISTVLSALGLLTLVPPVFRGFERLKRFQNYEDDVQRSLTQFQIAHIGFDNWKQSLVALKDDLPRLENCEERKAAASLLREITELFTVVEKVMDKHTTKRPSDTDGTVTADERLGNVFEADDDSGTTPTERSPWGSTLRRKTGWVLRDRTHLAELATQLHQLVRQLVTLFPGTTEYVDRRAKNVLEHGCGPSQSQQKEDEEQPNGGQSFQRDTSRAATGTYLEWLSCADKDSFGHFYGKVNLGTEAETVFGDQVASDWEGSVNGRKNTYQDIVTQRGAKTIMGNMLGGDSLFKRH